MFYLLSIFWFFRQAKALLFWLYLWQLKEYHFARFLDHFRTEKGKKVFLNPIIILKIILLFYVLFLFFSPRFFPQQFYASWIIILTVIYFFESLKFFSDFFKKEYKKPVLTPKSLSLMLAAALVVVSFFCILFQNFYFVQLLFKNIFAFTLFLLLFDLLTPFIAAIIVFFVHFFAVVFFRNRIIKKAAEKRKKLKDLTVIGVCGSYGKTSTKEFLAEILSKKFNVLKTKKNQNSEVGISQCILNELKKEHQVFIVEMGAYNKGGIKLLCDIVRPKIGIIAGINEQHLSTFSSMKNLISAEGGKELVESLPKDGFAIFNGNNKYCQEIYQKTKINKKISYAPFSPDIENLASPDIWAEDIKIEKQALSFKAFSRDGDSAGFRLNLLGLQNIENVLLAACCAKEIGVTLGEASEACQNICSFPRHMELKQGKNNVSIIDSTYSANPDGVLSHLEYLKVWPAKKIIIMPCLIELGAASKEVHKKIGQKISEVCDLAIITTKERFEDIRTGAAEKGMKKESLLFLEDPRMVLERIKPYLEKENVILLEGRIPEKLIDVLLEKQ